MKWILLHKSDFMRGSQWRRWDLHIHSPETKLANSYRLDDAVDVWDRYIDELETSAVQVFGITDYFSCDNYFEFARKHKAKYPKSEKVFFCNIEFRFSEAISKDDKNPDVHVIFSNDLGQCSEDKIRKFLSTLKVLGNDSAGAKVFSSELKERKDFESASVSIDDLKRALEDAFGNKKPYLVGCAEI